MPTLNILWPTFALVALIFVVWSTLVVQRLRHIRRTPPRRGALASGTTSRAYFEPVALPADNLANLFELPVLFFALVPLLILTKHADHLQVLLAWAFAALRTVHSAIHIVVRDVRLRFFAYLASVVVLVAMWAGFFVDMIAAAGAYHAALVGMPPQP